MNESGIYKVIKYKSSTLSEKDLYAIFVNGELDIPSFLFLSYEARTGGRKGRTSSSLTNRSRAYKTAELYEHLNYRGLDWRTCHEEDIRQIRNEMLHWNMMNEPDYSYYEEQIAKMIEKDPHINEMDMERISNNSMNQKLSVWFKFFKYQQYHEESMELDINSIMVEISIPDSRIQHIYGRKIGQNKIQIERWTLMVSPSPTELVYHALTKEEYDAFKSQLMKIDPVYAAIAEMGVESGLRIAALLRDVTYEWFADTWKRFNHGGVTPEHLKDLPYINKGGNTLTAKVPYRTGIEIRNIYIAGHHVDRWNSNQLSKWRGEGNGLWYRKDGKPINYTDVMKAFRQASVAMGRTVGVDSITSHWLRHTFATWTIIDGVRQENKLRGDNKIDLRKLEPHDVPKLMFWLQARLGHATMETTTKYITTAMYLLAYGSTGPAVSSFDLKRKDVLLDLLRTHAVARYGEEFDKSKYDPVKYAIKRGYAVEFTPLSLNQ
jgi:integrase